MEICRVCGAELGAPILQSPPPSITSICTLLDVDGCVWACDECGHAQSANLNRIEQFYDTEYRISLATEGYDQLYEIAAGRPVFRAEHQAKLVKETCELRPGSVVLDYGAAKAGTLRQLSSGMPGLECYVYDVSRDYQASWQDWIPAARQATYEVPEAWADTFDLVTAHFVLEHVVEPVKILKTIARVLKPAGHVFFLVPDPISNPGDLVVVDHVNHFTESSLRYLCKAAGLSADVIERHRYRGAFLVVAGRTGASGAAAPDMPRQKSGELRELAAFWKRAAQTISKVVADPLQGKSAVYGAGFYGTFIAACLKERHAPVCFVDKNPYVRLVPHLGLPVLDPQVLPLDVETVFAGLNPKIARSVLEQWKLEIDRPDLKIVYLDE